MAIKKYILEIVYDDEDEAIEHIQEYIEGDHTETPAFGEVPSHIEVPRGYWQIYDGEPGEA